MISTAKGLYRTLITFHVTGQTEQANTRASRKRYGQICFESTTFRPQQKRHRRTTNFDIGCRLHCHTATAFDAIVTKEYASSSSISYFSSDTPRTSLSLWSSLEMFWRQARLAISVRLSNVLIILALTNIPLECLIPCTTSPSKAASDSVI